MRPKTTVLTMQGFLTAAQRSGAYWDSIKAAIATGTSKRAAFRAAIEPELNFLVGRAEFKHGVRAQPVGRNLDVNPRILGVDPVVQDIQRRKVSVSYCCTRSYSRAKGFGDSHWAHPIPTLLPFSLCTKRSGLRNSSLGERYAYLHIFSLSLRGSDVLHL